MELVELICLSPWTAFLGGINQFLINEIKFPILFQIVKSFLSAMDALICKS